MSFLSRSLVLLALLLVSAPVLPAQSEAAIQQFINEAIKAGGGSVVIPPGTYVIEKGLVLKDAKKIKLSGLDRERTILKLAPIAYAEAASDTPAGVSELPVKKSQNFRPGMQLHIEAPGDLDSFTKKPKPHHLAIIKSVSADRLELAAPLKHPVPAGTQLRHADAPNLIEIRGASEQVLIENLTIDGGRTATDPAVRGHAQLCGIFASGAYDYEKGPTSHVKGVTVSRCIIQNCFGRGVAFYAVGGSIVERSTIMDTNDEAIDFDHFAVGCIARHNHIARSLTGIELNDATDCQVSGNDIRSCGTGLNLWRWCRQPGLNERNRILDNLFANTAGNAIQIGKDTGANVIADNQIDQAGKNGIVLGSPGQTLENNRFEGVKLKDVTAP
ncbi:right-handed parallel beta-helix repeat-containing protein [Verrucomicrobium sp. BvORR106]|uniref:right-handed parallel beta-helix repeat-containing protein n=1 Tax=Verrucomicrobium sp. BvORR106 TaxID=1403819 RepID=UPI00056F4BBD|nr:right-handed parallel beta-helix repeat-containing protein [Verrucomicrobium sp. BvORR106]